ncbi:MAG: type VI secretion system Vgr family protein [Phycisphaerales bacterium]
MARKLTQAHRSLAINTPLGADKLVLLGFSGSEALSTLFEYDAALLSEDTSIALVDLVGQPVTIRVELTEDRHRTFSGIVSRFVHTGFRRAKDGEGGSGSSGSAGSGSGGGGGGGGGSAGSNDGEHTLAEYRAAIVPRMWLLTRRADCRIFKGKTVPQIVKEVCAPIGLDVDDRSLESTYAPWDYCVQYRETDYNFVARLLEQEGIFYFFRHEEENHVLVLGDAPARLSAFKGYEEIRYMPPDSNTRDLETVHAWSVGQEMMPGRFAHKDFDFVAPDGLSPSIAQADQPAVARDHEVFDYPGEYLTSAEGDALAGIRLEELHVRSEVGRGSSDSRGVVVGSLFKLTDHPRETEPRTYLVASAAIEARALDYESAGGQDTGPAVSVEFTALDSTRRFRPPRITPKPVIQGPQTAIVVGKPADDGSGGSGAAAPPSSAGPPEEIATDEHGRVWVRFHWDRAETPSCPVRVAQMWAGKKWGGMFIPRIGQEVIIEFLEGDPDRPIITGRVYNGTHKPPYDLPTNKTISTIKSDSSTGGGGFNEIRFEDKKGEEQVFIHGQKDYHLRVTNEEREWVGQDRHLWVVNDQFETVKHDRHETVENDHFEKVVRDRNLLVAGKEAKHVKKSLSLTVTENVAEVFDKDQSTMVTGDLYIKAQNIVIEGGTNITLKVGTTSIAIEENGVAITTNGSVKVDAKLAVELTSSGADFKAKGLNASVEGSIEAKLEGAASAVVKGGMVKIN